MTLHNRFPPSNNITISICITNPVYIFHYTVSKYELLTTLWNNKECLSLKIRIILACHLYMVFSYSMVPKNVGVFYTYSTGLLISIWKFEICFAEFKFAHYIHNRSLLEKMRCWYLSHIKRFIKNNHMCQYLWCVYFTK